MNESGQLDAKIKDLFDDEPSRASPLPPMPGEDDESELASIVKKMKESIILKDRFYKMRRFRNSQQVWFLSIEVKPKPITEIASRLRFLSHAIFEAYASEDGRHVDCRSIHGSEEFKRVVAVI
ncbi:unnamed protein product [Musa acuminata subsp. malaccensis]|uniref:(wild Malaysian banana) hypothetical protein n=1 Tax=Musa acuminata subsp. malaccensis TaxID=214687 RepID=A0A804KR56_MUSAM|nr:unnamed protein product [Musa acuminata subsp. malaccensis]